MEPENDGLEDHFSFLNGWFVGSTLIFQGVNIFSNGSHVETETKTLLFIIAEQDGVLIPPKHVFRFFCWTMMMNQWCQSFTYQFFYAPFLLGAL